MAWASATRRIRHRRQREPGAMFGPFKKSPTAKLEKEHREKLKEARDLQRGGDIRGYAAKMAEAEKIAARIQELKSGQG